MRSAARLSALLLVGLGSACALGPDYTRPELPAPETFREQPAETQSLADLPWFEVFRDEALGAYVREALDNNRDLQLAAARVEQARYLAAVARSPLFPQLGYDAATARGDQAVLGTPARPPANATSPWSGVSPDHREPSLTIPMVPGATSSRSTSSRTR